MYIFNPDPDLASSEPDGERVEEEQSRPRTSVSEDSRPGSLGQGGLCRVSETEGEEYDRSCRGQQGCCQAKVPETMRDI